MEFLISLVVILGTKNESKAMIALALVVSDVLNCCLRSARSEGGVSGDFCSTLHRA